MYRSLCAGQLLVVLALLLVTTAQVSAQQSLPVAIQERVSQLQANHAADQEFEIWIQYDQPYYLTTDSVELSIFVYSKTNRSLGYNGQLWLDLVSRQNEVRRNLLINVVGGRALARISLGSDLAPDYYMVAAYTQELAACGTACFYKQPILLLPPFSESETGRERLFVNQGSTSLELQAFPVTGQLIDGIESDVYLRARRGRREGVPLTGMLTTLAGDTIDRFRLDEFGLGTLTFTPRADQQYQLRVDSGWEISETFPLRQVAAQGVSLNIDNLVGRHVRISVERTAGYNTKGIYLLVQGAGKLLLQQQVYFDDNNREVFTLKQEEFPSAIAEAVLMREDGTLIQRQLFYPLEPSLLRLKPIIDGTDIISLRQEVTVEGVLQSLRGEPLSGNVSVAVWDKNQFDPLAGPPQVVSAHYLPGEAGQSQSLIVSKAATLQKQLIMRRAQLYDWDKKAISTDRDQLPIGKSFFISGSILSAEGEPIPGSRAAFLLLKNRFTFLAIADDQGRFEVEVPQLSANEDAIYRVFSGSKEYTDAQVVMDSFSPAYTVTLPDKPEKYSKAIQDYRRKASVRSTFLGGYQDYYDADTVSDRDYKNLDLPKPDFSVSPDDFVVMQSMEEMFREIVPGVFLRARKDGFKLRIFSPERRESFTNEPLILIDAQPVFDVNQMLEIDPFDVKRIDTYNYISSMSQFGSLGSNGILSIITKKGDYKPESSNREKILQIKGYANVAPQPRLSAYDDAGMPNLHPLVYWNPDLRVDSNGYIKFRYQQSDEISDFILLIQGYTDLGEPVIYYKEYSSNGVSN